MQFPCIGSGRNFEKSKGMKINVAMPSTIKAHYRVELEQYSMAFQQMNLPLAWRHLERAHILGQAWPTEHTRSEEHTSELQSLMRISYAVFWLKKKKITIFQD